MADFEKTNADYQKEWYRRQKNRGIVYSVTIRDTGDVYIGVSTDSLKKIEQRHRARSVWATKPFVEKYGKDCIVVDLLDKDVRKFEEWTAKLQPTLNKKIYK